MSESPSLHVEHSGSGVPLVLAHGFGGSSRNFRPQARAFAARAEVWLYDARGHARSAAPSEPAAYSEAELVADFERVVAQARSAGRAPIVGGLSLGAYTALRWALGARERPRGLVLAAFPGGAERARWALEFAREIEERGLERAGGRFVWGEVARFDAKAGALIRQGLLEHPPQALAATLRNVLSSLKSPDELASALSGFDVKTLIIVGSEDRDSLAPSERLASLMPKATLTVVPGAGHVVNLAAPAAFNAALGSFLDELD